MTDRLSEEKLIEILKSWSRVLDDDNHWNEAGWEDGQAYKQILALIKKPEVTEEWIEEKARKAWDTWWYKASGQYAANFNGTIRFDYQGVKNLIRSLVEEIKDG